MQYILQKYRHRHGMLCVNYVFLVQRECYVELTFFEVRHFTVNS